MDRDDDSTISGYLHLHTQDNTDETIPSQSENAAHKIGRKESDAVWRLRLVMIAVISVAAVLVSFAIYWFTSDSQRVEFHQQFDGAASKVLSSFHDIVESKLTAIASLALQASIYGKNGVNNSWPFVTLDEFQIRSAAVRDLSGALFTRIVQVVTEENREKYENYTLQNLWWLQEANEYLEEEGLSLQGVGRNLQTAQNNEVDFSSGIGNKLYGFDQTGTAFSAPDAAIYFPLWQESPSFKGRDLTNFNTMFYPDFAPYIRKVYETGEMSIGGLQTPPPGGITHPDLGTSYFAYQLSVAAGKLVEYPGDPMSTIFLPVFDDFSASERQVVAMIFANFKWASYFEDLLPPNSPSLDVILENSCEGPFTYNIIGEAVNYEGKGDLHDRGFDHLGRSEEFGSGNVITGGSALEIGLNQDLCSYRMRVYPTKEFEDEYVSTLPIIVTIAVAMVFVFTGTVFIIFNRYVERRQDLVMYQAVKSTAIVSSLFPEVIRDRLMHAHTGSVRSGKTRLKSFLSDDEEAKQNSEPIADLFPYCTVFFADISGFTAWSSSRDPSHVFLLLETIYQAFDSLASRRRVFKVETIGDCYVAVTGLPNPDEKHAVNMARFSFDCMVKFRGLVNTLECSLGPDTADLGLRIGLHTGPVTAGVLRGERSRFQLFGDTVNTASRMESAGAVNKIQVSGTTACLLAAAGKEHWCVKREDCVDAKGKGVLETYWLHPKTKSSGSVLSASSEVSTDSIEFQPSEPLAKRERLIEWMVDLFMKRISVIVARQDKRMAKSCLPSDLQLSLSEGKTSLDEIAEVIRLPDFDKEAEARAKSRGKVAISTEIIQQLRDIISTIADMYKDNPFHNFEHSCQVTMAVDKFMNRIVTPDMDDQMHEDMDSKVIHDYTHGITSDPICLLAILFSALVHDADHRGVSNVQLAKEEERMAEIYKNKSIAEQNSLDICWEVLMMDKYRELRSMLFVERSEMIRFRQVLVNVVLATDIFDKELNALRRNRWNKAFSRKHTTPDFKHLRATIVIEHIIQASDVSHTMQHWHVYRKWNERLFTEMYKAYMSGRMDKDPSTFWYKGELGFFDNYIIPLAKKLKDCNVFGVSSDECLNYASQNRAEWKERGSEIVAEMIEKMEVKYLGL